MRAPASSWLPRKRSMRSMSFSGLRHRAEGGTAYDAAPLSACSMGVAALARLRHARRLAVSAILSLLLVFCGTVVPLGQPSALADVRKADVVMGQTVDSRGLAVAQCPNIAAEYVLVCDDEGTVYFERNAQEKTAIASITKVMTAIVALENAPLDTKVTVSSRAARIGESSAELQEGDLMTLEAALKALMIPSGNDAAQAIAETVGSLMSTDGQDGYATFVQAMNDKAAELGMTDSVFENPHGLDFGTYAGNLHSTAHDVSLMCAHAMRNETFRQLVNVDAATIEVVRNGVAASVSLESTDKLLGVYEGACGIKTGLTDLAGPSFAGACEREGKTLFAIVIHSSSEERRFEDATTLFDWVYEHEIVYPLAHSKETATMTVDGQTRSVPVVAEVAHAGWVDATVKVTFADPDASVQVFDLNGNVSQTLTFENLEGNVRVGDKVGTATFKQRNNVIATVDLVACEDQAAPNFFEGIGVFWDRLFCGFSGAQTVAQSVTLNETPLINDKSAGGA